MLINHPYRQSAEFSKEALKHLEDVFRANLGKDKEEFTITDIKKIVPSKNVSKHDTIEK